MLALLPGVRSEVEQAQRPNKRLRLQRRLRGWSQEDVAAGLHRLAAELDGSEPGVDAAMVSRWERGTRRPRPRYVRLLCNLFELPAEQLGIVEDPDLGALPEPAADALEDDELGRRDFISQVSALLDVAPLPMPRFEPAGQEPWERLARALRRPGRVDDETLDHVEQITVALQSLGPTQVGPRALLGPVTGHLDAITMLLQGAPRPGLRVRLCSLAAETAGLAGWLRWSLGDADAAAAYFQTALDAAHEAGDRALGAWLMGSAACQPPHREDPHERLRQLRGRTHGFVQADATRDTRVWLAAKEADACAMLGDAAGCLHALDQAETELRCRDRGESPRPRFSSVDETWLGGERGASLARLGMTREARAILQRVLAALGPSSEHDRVWLFTSLASTYATDAEPEEAVRVARLALNGASRLRLEPVLRVLDGLRGDLAPYEDSAAVRQFDELLRSRQAS
jgi:transcriptional regulator with XRE-family HTH domain